MSDRLGQNTEFFFLQKHCDDALHLLVLARDYFSRQGERDRQLLDPISRLYYNGAMSKITLRLTSAVSWLMVRKAVAVGEMPEEVGTLPEYRLAHPELCLAPDQGQNGLPLPVRHLLEQSLRLYECLKRIDDRMPSAEMV